MLIEHINICMTLYEYAIHELQRRLFREITVNWNWGNPMGIYGKLVLPILNLLSIQKQAVECGSCKTN